MRLLITESEDFSSNAIAQLEKHFEVQLCDFQSIEELRKNIEDIEVLFVRLRFKLTREILEKAHQLKYILTATTGLDHIDVAYFESQGGKVISLKDEVEFLGSIPSTAEHSWALLLALLKKIPVAFNDVKNGNWNRDNFKGNNLKGKKIGILGLGRVGKQVAQFAEAFGMIVGFYDVIPQNNKYKSFENPETMFVWADIISIHIPYTDANENFVNAELLSYCNPNTILINTSRGKVWDEIALAELLQKNKIKGFATDVLWNEFDAKNLIQNPLVALAQNGYNIIITPHIAGASYESMEMTEDFVTDKLINLLKFN